MMVGGVLEGQEKRRCFIDGKSKGREKLKIVVDTGCTQMSVEHAYTPTQTHVSETF
jgi:hypothetical protein